MMKKKYLENKFDGVCELTKPYVRSVAECGLNTLIEGRPGISAVVLSKVELNRAQR